MELNVNDYKVEISARHVHLSRADFVTLFGEDAELKNIKDLSIKGEFKSDKSVTVVGPKRTFERVVVLGPWRDKTQVEISLTDSYSLGVKNVPVRMSGDLANSAPVTLVGPAGTLELKEGMIIALRHIHIGKPDMKSMDCQMDKILKLRLVVCEKQHSTMWLCANRMLIFRLFIWIQMKVTRLFS